MHPDSLYYWLAVALVAASAILLSAHALAILARNEATLLKAKIKSLELRAAHLAALQEQQEIQDAVEIVEEAA